MQILTRMKLLVVVIGILIVSGLLVYNSNWFQKKYIYPLPYQGIIYRYALDNNVDPFLIAGVIRTESKFFPQARSPKGALGLMQMMPETAEWVAEQVEYHEFSMVDLEEPEISIRFGTWYLSSLKKEFQGNEVLMLAAYNGGRGNVRQWMSKNSWTMDFQEIQQIPFKETREYVERVLRSKQHYQELYGR